MAVVYYFTRKDLEHALGRQTVKVVFDEDGSDEPAADAVTACRAYGTSECRSFIIGNYGASILPQNENSIPDELRFAAIDFGCAYAMRRKPETVAAMGLGSWLELRKEAVAKMERFIKAQQRIASLDGNAVIQPANVGATVITPVVVNGGGSSSSSDDAPRSPFDDMGDF